MALLGVNIDHIATLRQARQEKDPDPIEAALICQKAGADSIVAHLREDRRHIQDADIKLLKKKLSIPLNLEMSINPDIVKFACQIKPDQVTLVPEKRKELTTEGGLNVIRHFDALIPVCLQLKSRGIKLSLFIDPDEKQINATLKLGVDIIELHTGVYAMAPTKSAKKKEWKKLAMMTEYAHAMGLTVNAGHGLKYHDTKEIAQIHHIHELNIGHSIIAKSVFMGLEQAVQTMKALVV